MTFLATHYAHDRIGKLIEDMRQGRQLLNRGSLE
jgi:hypothetical protein